MSKIKINLLKFSLFLIFTQGLWERILSFSPIVEMLMEISIIIFIIFPSRKYLKKSPGYIQLLLLVFVGIIVAIGNNSGLYNWFKYTRYLLYFYLIFNQLWINPISMKKWVGILKFISFLIILQGVGAFYNIFILNQRVEGYVGLMSSSGGTTATAFPLLIISICLLLWFFNKKQSFQLNFILFLIFAGSMLVGYSSSKRGIFFLIPIFVLIVSLVSGFKLYSKISFYRKLIILVMATVLMTPIFVYGIVTSHGLNYGLSGKESSFGVIKNAVQYALIYENSESEYGETTGRSNTSKAAVVSSLTSKSSFFWGNGYGSIKDDSKKFTLGIDYGIVGFSRDIISGGWLIMFLTFSLFASIILINKANNEMRFSQGLKLVLFLIFIVIHFGYSSDFTSHLKVSSLVAIFITFINSPTHSIVNTQLMKKYFY